MTQKVKSPIPKHEPAKLTREAISRREDRADMQLAMRLPSAEAIRILEAR